MHRLASAAFMLIVGLASPVVAQQDSQKALQNEADKGIKTENSGASGFVNQQEKAGSAAKVPGGQSGINNVTTAPSPTNSGAGIAGSPGNKNGPPPGSTSGPSSQNPSVQDTSGVKGLPGSKSGPAAKK